MTFKAVSEWIRKPSWFCAPQFLLFSHSVMTQIAIISHAQSGFVLAMGACRESQVYRTRSNLSASGLWWRKAGPGADNPRKSSMLRRNVCWLLDVYGSQAHALQMLSGICHERDSSCGSSFFFFFFSLPLFLFSSLCCLHPYALILLFRWWSILRAFVSHQCHQLHIAC